MIQVVNKRTYTGPWDETVIYVGRPSPLGNPYTHLAGTVAQYHVPTREDAVIAYATWIRLLQDGTPAKDMLDQLVQIYRSRGRLTLVCWCSPLRCHADVLAEIVEKEVE